MSDLSIQWLIVFVDVSVKASLVALVAAAGLALLRVRDSNVRHRVWTGVLYGMLLLPALTQVVPALRLPIAVDPDWFAVLGGAEAPDDADQDAGLSPREPELSTVSRSEDSQPAPDEGQAMAARDDRTPEGRFGWQGAPGQSAGNLIGGGPRSPHQEDDAAIDGFAKIPDMAVAPASKNYADAGSVGNGTPLAVAPSLSRIILARLPLAFWSIWAAGGMVLVLRLFVGLWAAHALRCCSRTISADELHTVGSDEQPEAALRRQVPILECPRIRVPLTLGVIHPRILLPSDWIDWSQEKLQAVLAHERTHAERGDCALALLAEVNRCVYWFHPLAWWLRRRLASLAETACDDAAIGSTGDRASYARHLLEVAATARAHRGRLIAGSVSMARRSNVETRINAILDFTRPLSQRLTRGMAIVLVGIIVPLVALAAALRPSNGQVEESVPVLTAADESLSPATEGSPSEALSDNPSTEYSVLNTQSSAVQDSYRFAGQVVGPEGQPVPGASISLNYFQKSPLPDSAATPALTDNHGRFEFTLKSGDFTDRTDADKGYSFWIHAGLAAVKEGFGFAFGPAAYFETSGRLASELTDEQRKSIEREGGQPTDILKLIRDDVPIRGKVLNAEGKPVAGAKIEALEFREGKDGSLDAWETAANEQDADLFSAQRQTRQTLRGYWMSFSWGMGNGSTPPRRLRDWGNMFTGTRPPVVRAVRSDADGRFMLEGIGRDRIVEIRVSGQGIETMQQYVRTRNGEIIKLPFTRTPLYAGVAITYYPSDLTLVGGQSAPITGRVTDAKTGQPIAGAGVQSVEQSSGAVTDADGNYRLEGLPLGATRLLVTPPTGSRHLTGGVTVTTIAGAPSVVRDIALTAGVLIRGRAIDERTGKPVRGQIEYFAYETNPYRPESDSLRQTGRHTTEYGTDADGRFEIPALPGAGILALRTGGGFPDGVGADLIDCAKYEGMGDAAVFKTIPGRCMAGSHNLLVSINPQPGDDEVTVDLTLRSGINIPGRVLSLDGQPLRDYLISGAKTHVPWQQIGAQDFSVIGYFPTETRQLLVYHAGLNLAGVHILKGEPPEKIQISLRPAATLVGRALDAEGAPLEHADILSLTPRSLSSNVQLTDGELEYGVVQHVATDAQGRFEIKGVVPGLKYTAHVKGPKTIGGTVAIVPLGSIFCDVVAEPGETKDLGDLKPIPREPAKPDEAKTGVGAGTAKAAAKSPLSTEYSVLSTQSADDAVLTYAGTVVGPDGEPVAGAKLRFWYYTRDSHPDLRPLAITASDGTFRFSQSKSDLDKLSESGDAWKSAMVVATADGHGFGIKNSADFETTGAVRAAQTAANAATSESNDRRIALKAGTGKSRRVRFFGRDGGQFFLESNPTKTLPPEQIVVLKGGINMLLDTAEAPTDKPAVEAIELSADDVVLWTDRDSVKDFGGEISQPVESPLRMYLEGNVVIRQGKNVLRTQWAIYDVHQDHAHALDAKRGGQDASKRKLSSMSWKDIATEYREPAADVIRLVADDVPVRARIIDVEGRPVAGARLDVLYVWQSKDETLEAWEQEISRPGTVNNFRHENLVDLMNGPRTAVVASTTRPDRDGWIQINGLGKERIAKVQLSGPGIESAVFHVRTRRGKTIRLPRDAGRSMGDEIYHPAEFTHVAGPSQPVTGTITDAKTGAPLAGCIVQGDLKSSTDGRSFFQFGKVAAKTDAAGRYQLEGLTPGNQHLVVLPPRGTAFLPAGFTVKTGTKPTAVSHDAQLFAGVRLRGSVTDSRSGKPIAASLRYDPFSNNPAVKSVIGLEPASLGPYYYSTDAQGRFELAALPGKGVLAITAHNHDAYPIAAGLKQAKALAAADRATAEFSGSANLVTVVDLTAEAENPSITLTLDPGQTVPGTVAARDGTGLADYLIYGGSQYPFWNENKGEAFQVQGYFPSGKRRLMFFHPARNLVGVYELTGEPPESVKIVLHPGGVLKGRIVDKTGLPLEGAEIVNANAVMASPMAVRPVDDPTRGVLATRFDQASKLRTGADGRFELRGIIPGLKYSAAAFGQTDDRPDHFGKIFSDVIVAPGEMKDLGDLVPNRDAVDPPAGLAPAADAAEGVDAELPIPEPKTVRESSAATTISVAGVVLKPDGTPAARATVRAAAPLWAMLKPIVGADFQSPMSERKTDAQGRFTISFPTQPFGDVSRLDDTWKEIWRNTTIAASLDRFGPAWVTYDEIESGKSVTLRLVEDVPVRGRVVDLEGRPVAGAVVKFGELHGAAGDDLSPWIDGIKAGELPWTVIKKASRFLELRLIGLPGHVTTAADGTIALRGLGRERYMQLIFEGETVAYRHATLVTRQMDAMRRTISAPPFESTEPVFGAEFTFTADPARTIEGGVRDAKSGEALAGVSVESYKLVGYPYSNNRVLKTKTDKLGRFRLTGMPKGSGNRLLLVPNDEQPYFMREVDVADPVGLGPAQMEIELHRGIWISGRVTDQATGQPVPVVKMYYLPWLSNAYAQQTPEFDAIGNVNGDQWRYVTKSDGTYRLVGLPGLAIVGADSVLQSFRSGIGFDAITGTKNEGGDFATYRNPINPGRSWPTMMQEINPPADASDISLDFALDPGRSVKIRVVDGDGTPVTGVSGTGLTTHGGSKPSPQAVLVAHNLGPSETRRMVLRHQGRKIGRVVTIGPEQIASGEIVVELQPVSKVVGQLCDADGGPISGMDVEPRLLPPGDMLQPLSATATGSDGRFEVVLIPGCHYSLAGQGGGFQFVSIVDDLALDPGVTRDLGTIVIGADGNVMRQEARREGDSAPEKAAARKAPQKVSATPSTVYSVLSTQSAPSTVKTDGSTLIAAGTILGPDGKPVANAHVAFIGSRIRPERGGDLSPRSAVLAETVTDGGGRFEFQSSGVSSKTLSWACVIARSDDSGLAWRRIDPDARKLDLSLELPVSQAIRGRFIDVEGRLAGAVRVAISSVTQHAGSANRVEPVGYYNFGKAPRAWPAGVTADQDGNFEIRGIPADHGVYLAIEGTDRFAPQDVALNTGAPEQRTESDGTYRSLVRNVKPGEQTVLALAPAQIFEGVVRYADTNEPAPQARLTVHSTQQEGPGSWLGLAGKADARGSYRINAHPGVRFSIMAYPPDGVPYLIREIRDVTHRDGAFVKQVDVSLPRGVLVRGHTVESRTKTPIAGTVIQYVPEQSTRATAPAGVVTGWQGIQLADADGAFEIAVLPGSGTLLANGPGGEFVLQEIGSRQLERGLPGGDRNYTHAFQRINPEQNSDPLDLTMELRRGATVDVRLINAAHEPVEHALVVSRLFVNPSELFWRGFPKEAFAGRFELSGLGEGVEYPVHFLDAKNRVGATAVFKAGDKSPAVVLVPCGGAVASFIDGTGKPVAGQPLQFVATPGPHRFSQMAEAAGELTADATFYSNIDRTHPGPQFDPEGRTSYTGLIPGGRYQILDFDKGRAIVVKEFVAESEKTLDLGKITMTTRKEE